MLGLVEMEALTKRKYEALLVFLISLDRLQIELPHELRVRYSQIRREMGWMAPEVLTDALGWWTLYTVLTNDDLGVYFDARKSLRTEPTDGTPADGTPLPRDLPGKSDPDS